MTAPVDEQCECGHPRSRHKGGKGGCRNCDIGCGRYEADAEAEAVPTAEPARAEDLPIVAVVSADPDAAIRKELRVQGLSSGTPEFAGAMAAARASEKSTSARLREALAANDRLAMEHAKCVLGIEQLRTERDRARAERDEVERQRTLLRDRIAELEQLLADAGLKLVNQQTEAAAEVRRLRVLLEQAGTAAPVEIHGWDAWQCFTCGSRYRRDFQHACGPLTAVRVHITER